MDRDRQADRVRRSGSPDAAAPASRTVLRATVGGIVLAVLAVLTTGCASVPVAPSSQIVAAPTSTGFATSSAADDLFASDIVAKLGQSTGLGRPEMITAGQHMCQAISGAPSHAALIDTLIRAKFDPQEVEVFLTAAERDLCPTAVYGRPAAIVTETPEPTDPALTTIPDGTFQVGTGPGQVQPGIYRAAGPTDLLGVCHYARLRTNDGSLIDIISHHDTVGSNELTVEPTDGYVEVTGCTFTRT